MPTPEHLFNQTVTVEPFSGRDAYGQPSYGAAKTYKARVEHRRKFVRGPDGATIVANTQVHAEAAAAAVTVQDRITLPDGTRPAILSKGEIVGRLGDTVYVELLLE